jgi:hypothetical protein
VFRWSWDLELKMKKEYLTGIVFYFNSVYIVLFNSLCKYDLKDLTYLYNCILGIMYNSLLATAATKAKVFYRLLIIVMD